VLKRQYFPWPVDLARRVPLRSESTDLPFISWDQSQLSWRLPEPVLPADPMLTAPILPMPGLDRLRVDRLGGKRPSNGTGDLHGAMGKTPLT
jgi:hypothetical protein